MRAWMLIGTGMGALLMGGCPSEDTGQMAPGMNVSLQRDVQPILEASCTGCHSDGGFAEVSGIPMLLSEGDTHAQIVGANSVVDDSLTFVVPGDPDASYFFEKIASDAPNRGARMPLFGAALSDAEIETIRIWIAEGAEDN